jgi:hypothetical protein
MKKFIVLLVVALVLSIVPLKTHAFLYDTDCFWSDNDCEYYGPEPQHNVNKFLIYGVLGVAGALWAWDMLGFNQA